MKKLLPYFKALCDERRIEIVNILLDREYCVCELIEKLSISQSTVSHHLKILKEAGFLHERPSGKWVYYSLNKKGFAQYESVLNEQMFKPVFTSEEKKCAQDSRCSD